MIAMILYREVCDEYGRHSMEAGVAMGMALEHAAPEIRQKMAADAHELGLIPPSLRFGPDGEPVYTAQDLGAFYGLDAQAVRNTCAAALSHPTSE